MIKEEFLQFWLRRNLGLVKHIYSNRAITSVNFFLELGEYWAKERKQISFTDPSPPGHFCTLGL